jgi:hypothetical protein
MISREPIYAALFAKLQAIQGVVTCSRILKHWSEVGTAEQPALYLAQKSMTAEVTFGKPTRWTLEAEVYIYVRTDRLTEPPATQMNNLIDAVEAALAPDQSTPNVQTLGGLVSHCWINGKIETDEGTLGEQAVAVIPINMLAA